MLAGGAAGSHTLSGIKETNPHGDRLVEVIGLTGNKAGSHAITAGEDTAGTLDIVTGLTSITFYQLWVVTAAGVHVPLADAAISVSGGTITLADGAATFAATATDVVYWTAQGAEAAVDLTSEFSISADDTLSNSGGTDTTGMTLIVRWYDADWGYTSQLSQLA